MDKKQSVRLPNTVIPVSYKLTLMPDLEGFLFKGEEDIRIEIKKPVREITLHAREMLINHEVAYVKSGKEKVKVEKIVWNDKLETATFVLLKKIQPGKAVMHIEFEGKLAEGLRGFYRAKYLHNGKEKYLATTQFEATDARAAFPCFDEPAHKAVFDVSFVIPNHLEAISNTVPISVEEHSGNFKRINFSSTPKMSTYLLAFIVGEFENISAKTKDGIEVRVFVTPGKKHQADFALKVAVKTLEYFNEFFGIKYPLPNLDMIGIPDFAAGAMENWGAVTYRESQLLVDPEHSSAQTKQWTALTVAHELAHQWFGNLVTMEWWTHLWLNEGFASYIEYVAVDHIFPEWGIWKQFVYIDFNTALELDSLSTTHPIEVAVNHPDEIGEIFDAISYHKGASVIRMLAEYLGEKDFRKGLHNYLKTHSYKNAKTDDLWMAFERASGKPIRKLMSTWISKAGYPYVEVSMEKSGTCVLKQGRFFNSEDSRMKSKDATLWGIPLGINSEDSKVIQKVFINSKKARIKVQPEKWVKFNAQETTPVRVKMPKSLLELLKPAIKAKNLEPLDRLGIIRDAFAFAESGQDSLITAFGLLEAYRDEDDFNVWAELAVRLSEVNVLFHDEAWYPKLDKFIGDIFSNYVPVIGFEPKKNEPHINSMLRGLILGQAGLHGNKKVITWAKQQFKNNKNIHPDLRGVVYSIAVRNGGAGEFKFLLEKYKKEQMAEERNRMLRGLGQTQNTKLILSLLELVLTDYVKLQDAPTLISAVWSNFTARKIVFEFMKKNWAYFEKTYGQGGHTLSRMIQPARDFHDKTALKDFKNFFSKHTASGAERTIDQVIEQITSNILWLARERKQLKDFLK